MDPTDDGKLPTIPLVTDVWRKLGANVQVSFLSSGTLDTLNFPSKDVTCVKCSIRDVLLSLGAQGFYWRISHIGT